MEGYRQIRERNVEEANTTRVQVQIQPALEVLSKGKAGSDVHLEMTTLVAEWGGKIGGRQSGGGHSVGGGCQESRRRRQWHGWAGGSGAERKEKEEQCQGLLVDWAAVGQEDSSLSQGFGAAGTGNLKEGQVWGKVDTSAWYALHLKSLGTSLGKRPRGVSLGCGIPRLGTLVWFL